MCVLFSSCSLVRCLTDTVAIKIQKESVLNTLQEKNLLIYFIIYWGGGVVLWFPSNVLNITVIYNSFLVASFSLACVLLMSLKSLENLWRMYTRKEDKVEVLSDLSRKTTAGK